MMDEERTEQIHLQRQGDHIALSHALGDMIVDITEDGHLRIRFTDNGYARIETQHVSWSNGTAMTKIEVAPD